MQEESYKVMEQKTNAAVRALHEVLEFNNISPMIRVSASIELMAQFLERLGVAPKTIGAIGRSISEAVRATEKLREREA